MKVSEAAKLWLEYHKCHFLSAEWWPAIVCRRSKRCRQFFKNGLKKVPFFRFHQEVLIYARWTLLSAIVYCGDFGHLIRRKWTLSYARAFPAPVINGVVALSRANSEFTGTRSATPKITRLSSIA